MLITLSSSEPRANLIIEGGRNIKDTFVFRKTPDYSARPEMTQYGSEEPFTFMDDLEILIRSRHVAVQTAAQILSFYFRDYKSMKTRATSQHLGVLPSGASKNIEGALSEKTHVRHFISIPYTDEKEMEDIFIDLVNSAETSIHVVSPYLRPRKKLAEAFLRALERGVKVKVITRLNLKGDNVPKVSQDIYRDSVNKFYENFEIYSWEGNPELGDSILHTKAILVDEKLLYLGGVNINNRSFTHDVESGFLISGPKIPKDFLELYNGYYLKHSVPIKEKGSISAFSKIVIKLLGPYF
jgi:phosphatidylserine/phosphatidylglycerophosphate/cardiolipin synthase-like enzyme